MNSRTLVSSFRYLRSDSHYFVYQEFEVLFLAAVVDVTSTQHIYPLDGCIGNHSEGKLDELRVYPSVQLLYL